MNAFIKLPDYFKTHAPEDLYDLQKSPFAYSVGLEGLTYYEAISHDPKRLHTFNMMMMSQEGILPFLGMYPFSPMKPQVEAERERAFVVDVGGGRGQSLLEVQKETQPDLVRN